jgi:Tripartite tricarboxylate transporter family receptor
MSFRTACSAAACAVLVTLAPAARAQDWPNRMVLTISPLTAGNAADTVARIVLDQVGKQVGQSFVIENRPGAGGTTGSAAAAKADADGYTLFLLTASQGSYAALHKSLPYDPVHDFIPVAMFGVQPSVLVAAPSKGWTSVADLVNAAKAAPGVLNFASGGLGSASHWAGERLRLAAGINVQHIPFRGPVDAFTEVMSVLGRRWVSREDAARHRRSAARRNREGARRAGGAGATDGLGCRADADDRRRVRHVLSRRRRGDPQARERRQHRADELTRPRLRPDSCVSLTPNPG